MKAIDTEGTGLWPQAGSQAFAIGIYDGDEFKSLDLGINPATRRRKKELSAKMKQRLRSIILDSPTIFMNSRYDIKMFCEMGVFDWEEPGHPEFWENIAELSHLAHMYSSDDSQFKGSLKLFSQKYLQDDYEERNELDRIVDRCRNFIKRRLSHWKIASHETVPQCKPQDKFVPMDMWLPAAIYHSYLDKDEARKYFKDDWEKLPVIMNQYLRKDCVNTYTLACFYLEQLGDDLGQLNLNSQLHHVLWKMETKGLTVSDSDLTAGIEICDHWLDKLLAECEELTGLKPTEKKDFSAAALRRFIYEENEVPVKEKTASGLASTTADTLVKIKDRDDLPSNVSRFLTCLMALRKYGKKRTSFQGYQRVSQTVESVPYTLSCPSNQYIIFPSLNDTGTSTTRFSGNNPNPQNIEKGNDPFGEDHPEIAALLEQAPQARAIFGPPEDWWWWAIDYSQLQLRVFAAATNDPELIQSFADGYDFHDFMARAIFDIPASEPVSSSQRRTAKAVNFGFIFGSSEKKIDAVTHRHGMYQYVLSMFPHAREFIEETKAQIQDTGTVYTLGGYPLQIPLHRNRWTGQMEYAAHKGVCYIVQGTEGEIVKNAMRLTDDYCVQHYPQARLLLQIHDEIIFETPKYAPLTHIRNLAQIMVDAGQLSGVYTPVDAELHRNNLASKTSVNL